MSDYLTIKNKIVEKLKSLENVKYVYSYEKKGLEGYPAVVVLGFSVEDSLQDTKTNLRTYTFKVRCFQELASQTPEKVEEIMDNLIDKIIDLFAQDFTLGGTCEGCWVRGGMGWVDREVECRAYDLEIVVKKLVPV